VTLCVRDKKEPIMDVVSALLVVAQIAATFAGFTALLSLIRRERGHDELVLANFRVMMMIEQSMITLFLCFVPVLLLQTGIVEIQVWIAANAVLLVTVLARSVVAIRGIRQRLPEIGSSISRTATAANFAVSISISVLAIISLVISDETYLIATYFFGCIGMLFIAAAAFTNLVRSLLPTWREDE